MAFSPLNTRYEEQSRHRENRGRLGHAQAQVKTNGFGLFEFEDCIRFGMTFVERPHISSGFELIDPGEDYTALPQVTAYVTGWDKTSREHYVGAWVSVQVCDCSVAEPPIETSFARASLSMLSSEMTFKILHDFTFSGVALKDVPFLVGE